MSIKDSLLPEFDHEMATTRRVIERVPDADLAWKPHDKSMSLGQLAGHVGNMPAWCSLTLEGNVLEIEKAMADPRLTRPESRMEMLQQFDAQLAEARGKLAAQTDPALLAPWTFKKNGQEIFTMPRISALRSFVMNHMIHHRGQLSVYLRLRNVPVPPIYGPSADEQ
jgi:uncharacterized damage-inducible protein DinB